MSAEQYPIWYELDTTHADYSGDATDARNLCETWLGLYKGGAAQSINDLGGSRVLIKTYATDALRAGTVLESIGGVVIDIFDDRHRAERMRRKIRAGASTRTAVYINQTNVGTGDGLTYENRRQLGDFTSTPAGSPTVSILNNDLVVLNGNLVKSGFTSFAAGKIKIPEGVDGDRAEIMQHPQDQGAFFGGHRADWNTWSLDQGETWQITLNGTFASRYWFADDDATSTYKVLTLVADLATCRTTDDSYFAATFGSGDTLYVHLAGGGDPTGKIVASDHGLKLWNMAKEHINFRDIVQVGHSGGSIIHQDFTLAPPSNQAWIGGAMLYSDSSSGIASWHTGSTSNHAYAAGGQDVYNLAFQKLEVGHCVNAIYHYSLSKWVTWGLTVEDCWVHDVGVDISNEDAHGVGIQGGYNTLIQRNVFERTGQCVVPHTFRLDTADPPWVPEDAWDQPLHGFVVRDNEFYDWNGNQTVGIAIVISGSGTHVGNKSGIEIYRNLIDNYKGGIHSASNIWVPIYENLIRNCPTGLLDNRNSGTDKGAKYGFVRNRIEAPAGGKFIDVTSGAAEQYLRVYDHNTYVILAGSPDWSWKGVAKTWAQWQALTPDSGAGALFDPNSELIQ